MAGIRISFENGLTPLEDYDKIIMGFWIINLEYMEGALRTMKKPKHAFHTGFAHITNENSFPGGRYHLIFISLRA